MKLRAFVLSLVLVANLFNNVGFAGPREESLKRRRERINQTLTFLGFLNYAEVAAAAYNAGGLDPVAKEALEQNIPKLRLIEISKELAAKVVGAGIERLSSDPKDGAEIQKNLADLTTKLLMLKMQLLTDKFDASVESTDPTEIAKREKAMKDATELMAKEMLDKMKLEIVADMMNVMVGEKAYREAMADPKSPVYQEMLAEQQKIEKSVLEYLVVRMSHPEIRHTIDLGKAFAFAAVSQARTSKVAVVDGLETKIASTCRERGVNLYNYISDTYTHVDPKGRSKSVTVKNGDMVISSNGLNLREDFLATAGITPGGWDMRGLIARLQRMFKPLISRLIPDEQRLFEKVNQRQELPWWHFDRFKFWVLQWPVTRYGYAEAAMAEVHEVATNKDSKSRPKLANVQILGNRQSPGGVGGMTITGLEQYVPAGKIAVISLDAKKLAERMFGATYPKGGVIWTSRTATVSDGGETFRYSSDLNHKWKTDITEAEFNEMKALAKSNPEKFKKKAIELALRQMHQFMTSNEALCYGRGLTANHISSSGATPILAFLKSLGLDLQETPDKWNLYVAAMKALDTSKEVKNIHLEERPVSPEAMLVETPLYNKDGIKKIDFAAAKNVEDKALAQFAAPRPVQSQFMLDAVTSTQAANSHDYNVAGIAKLFTTAMAAGQMGNLGASDLPRLRTIYEAVKTTSDHTDLNVKSVIEYEAKDLGSSSEVEKRAEMYNGLMKEWGWVDRTIPMRENLTAGEGKGYHHWINAIQIKRNIKSYQIMNTARELSSWIVAQVHDRLGETSVQNAFAELTASLISQRPMNPPVKIGTEFVTLKGDSVETKVRKMEAREEFLFNYQRAHIENHARAVVAGILNLVYGEELVTKVNAEIKANPDSAKAKEWKAKFQKIYEMSWAGVERLYMDDTVGRANFLGQALAGVMQLEAALENKEGGAAATCWKKTMEQMEVEGSDYRHYFTDRMVQMTDKGKVETKTENGTMLITQNMAGESTAISQGATAADIGRASKHGMVGSLFLMIMDPVASAAKAKGGQSNLGRAMDWLAQKGFLPLGFSHIDYIYHKTIVVNGVKLIWKNIMDAYPNHNADDSGNLENAGGPRLTSLDQVINRASHSRALIAYRDPVAFRKAFLEELRDRIVASNIASELHKRGEEVTSSKNEQIAEIERMIEAHTPKHLRQGEPIKALEIWTKIYWEDGTNGQYKIRYRDHVTVNENGYYTDGIAFPETYDLPFSKEGFRPISGKEGVRAPTPMDMTAEEFKRFHVPNGIEAAMFELQNLTEGRVTQSDTERSKAWNDAVMERVIAKKNEFMEKGWIFMWVTEKRHMFGTTYCSFFEEMPFLTSVGFSPQFQVGGYREYVKKVGRFLVRQAVEIERKEKAGEKLNFFERKLKPLIPGFEAFTAAALLRPDVYSPTAYAINKGVPDSNIHQWDFEDRTYLERMRFSFKQFWTRYRTIKAALESVLPRTEINLTQSTPVDPTEKAGVNTLTEHYVEANGQAAERQGQKVGANDATEEQIERFHKRIGEGIAAESESADPIVETAAKTVSPAKGAFSTCEQMFAY